MKKLLLLLFLVPNLVLGEQIFLACTGSALSKFCSSSMCLDEVGVSNFSFDTRVDLYWRKEKTEKFVGGIFITSHNQKILGMWVESSLTADHVNDGENWALRDTRSNPDNDLWSITDILINRLSGQISAKTTIKNPKAENRKFVHITGDCKKTTKKLKF